MIQWHAVQGGMSEFRVLRRRRHRTMSTLTPPQITCTTGLILRFSSFLVFVLVLVLLQSLLKRVPLDHRSPRRHHLSPLLVAGVRDLKLRPVTVFSCGSIRPHHSLLKHARTSSWKSFSAESLNRKVVSGPRAAGISDSGNVVSTNEYQSVCGFKSFSTLSTPR